MRELIQDKLYLIKAIFLLNWILFVKDKLIFQQFVPILVHLVCILP